MRSTHTFTTLRAERTGFVLMLTLDHPATRNALTDEMVDDLLAGLEVAQAAPDIRAVVLRGTDGMFCAGADLKGTIAKLGQGEAGLASIGEDNRKAGRLFRRLAETDVTTIAVVEGPAFGGGFGLACCADVVIVTPAARFSLSETTLGLIPAQIAPHLVARIGRAAAKRLALTARRFGGAEAQALGLADHICVDAAEVEATLADVLAGIGRCAREANAATKTLLRIVPEIASDRSIEAAAAAFVAAISGEEGREGISAFVEKRPANWISQP